MNRASAFAAFFRSTLGSSCARLDQPEIGFVGRVVLQHVEDEAFLDRLAHRVEVERLAVRARRPSASCTSASR